MSIIAGRQAILGPFSKTVQIAADTFGRPNLNPPNVVDQDTLTLYSFTVDTDRMTYKFPIPYDYSRGNFDFYIIWTNDGGVDDLNKNVQWRLEYQVGDEGDVISGFHANSPKAIVDAYTSALGWVECHTGVMTIAAADFAGKQCVFLRLMAITAPAVILTCEPHLLGMCYTYLAKHDVNIR